MMSLESQLTFPLSSLVELQFFQMLHIFIISVSHAHKSLLPILHKLFDHIRWQGSRQYLCTIVKTLRTCHFYASPGFFLFYLWCFSHPGTVQSSPLLAFLASVYLWPAYYWPWPVPIQPIDLNLFFPASSAIVWVLLLHCRLCSPLRAASKTFRAFHSLHTWIKAHAFLHYCAEMQVIRALICQHSRF